MSTSDTTDEPTIIGSPSPEQMRAYLAGEHGPPSPSVLALLDDSITYLDHDPRGIFGPALRDVERGDHVHIRTSDRCLKNRGGELCTPRANGGPVDPEAAEAILQRLRLASCHPFKGPDDTDASMLREAVKRIERGFAPGGSNTVATVMRVLGVVADAIEDES